MTDRLSRGGSIVRKCCSTELALLGFTAVFSCLEASAFNDQLQRMQWFRSDACNLLLQMILARGGTVQHLFAVCLQTVESVDSGQCSLAYVCQRGPAWQTTLRKLRRNIKRLLHSCQESGRQVARQDGIPCGSARYRPCRYRARCTVGLLW